MDEADRLAYAPPLVLLDTLGQELHGLCPSRIPAQHLEIMREAAATLATPEVDVHQDRTDALAEAATTYRQALSHTTVTSFSLLLGSGVHRACSGPGCCGAGEQAAAPRLRPADRPVVSAWWYQGARLPRTPASPDENPARSPSAVVTAVRAGTSPGPWTWPGLPPPSEGEGSLQPEDEGFYAVKECGTREEELHPPWRALVR